MTPKIIVSVPHTGTRFLQDRLGVEKYVHTHSNWVHLHERIHDKQIIAPLRKPKDVWRSWCRRRDGGQDVLDWAQHFFAAWYVLHTIDQLYDVDFICVDKRDDERIEDWSSVGEDEKSHPLWKHHRADLRVIYKIPFVHRHYPSHLK